MKDAVIFDLDNTLLKYETDFDIDFHIIEKWLTRMGVENPRCIMHSDDWENIEKRMEYCRTNYETYMREWNPHYPKVELEVKRELLKDCKIMPYPDSRKMLQELQIPSALVTNSSAGIVRLLINKFYIDPSYDFVFTRKYDYEDLKKPDPRIAQRVFEKLRIKDPSKVAMVGDTETDMQFAKNSGMVGIAMHKEIKGCDLYFPNFAKLMEYARKDGWCK